AADPARLNAFAGFRFHQGMMRSPRFELIGADGAAGFAHIAPRPLAPTGFEALRDAFRAAQRGRPDLWAILRAGMDAPYLARLAWWRLAKRRLLWPSPSAYQLHLVIEQAPDPDNRLRLGARRDPLGAPIAEIDWAPGEADARAFRKMARAFAAHWRDCGYETRFGPLVWRSAPDAIALGDLSDAGDVFHPVGTTRIGAHPAEAVVDPSLGVFGLPGLYAASTSVFPSSGGANPTMTLILLTLRLAEHLTALHRRGADALPHRRAAP
ncbi:MAG: GMC family oxidoreductase, partial [Pseudomonadota bacterium]